MAVPAAPPLGPFSLDDLPGDAGPERRDLTAGGLNVF